MRKRIILIFLVVAAAGAGVYAIRENGRGQDHRLMVSGNIELTEVNIGFKTAGRLIERNVDEGDSVKKGQIIARLDRDQLAAQRDREGAGLNSAEAQLAVGRTSVEWQKATLAADVETRRADLAAAEAKLAELKNGSRPQEKQDAKAAVEMAQSEVDRAKADWDRAQTLFKNDDISRAQFDQYRKNWESAAAGLKSATEREGLVLAGPRVEEIDGQAAQVERARAALKTAEANALRGEAAGAGPGGATRRHCAFQGQPGADRLAAFRYRRAVAGGWCGAGEIGGRGRDSGAGDHRGDGGRYRPSVAARVHQRDGSGEGEASGRRRG